MGNLVSQKEGDVAKVVETIHGTLRAPHVDGGRIREAFLRRQGAGNYCLGRGASEDIDGRRFGEGAGIRKRYERGYVLG